MQSRENVVAEKACQKHDRTSQKGYGNAKCRFSRYYTLEEVTRSKREGIKCAKKSWYGVVN